MRLAAAALAALLTALPAAADTDVTTLVADELRARYGSALEAGDLRVELVTMPPGGSAELVEAIRFDPRSGRLAAIVRADGRRIRVEGRAWMEIEVAVPNRRIKPGEVIGKTDLEMMPVRVEQVSARVLADPSDLVGKEARRALTPGRMVQASAVSAPIVVIRNKPVTIQFMGGGLTLTAQGKALEDGGVGDLIRVQNVDSNRVITATITGHGAVSASVP